MFSLSFKSIRHSVIGLVVAAFGTAMLAFAGPASAAGYYPTGHVDPLYAVGGPGLPGSLILSGWAADADAPKSPIYVRVSVTWTTGTATVGQATQTQLANQYRSDLLGVTGPNDIAWGQYHGFTFDFTGPVNATGGQACVTALNVGLGSDRSLGCHPFQVGILT
jgi:hypothetical protein